MFATVWVFAAGFGSPLALFAGFIFGQWLGLLFALVGMTIGATLLYIFANYFLKEIIRDKFLNRFKKLEEKFRKLEKLGHLSWSKFLKMRKVGALELEQIFEMMPKKRATDSFCKKFVRTITFS